MQEFSLPLGESLAACLRRDSRTATNAAGMVALLNVKPTAAGLHRIEAIADPTNSVVSWPFPQLFKGKQVTLLAGANSISQLDGSWAPTVISPVDYKQPGTAYALAGSTSGWQFVDCFGTWVLMNGVDMLFSTGERALYGLEAKVFGQRAITIGTGCHFQGRLIFAGFNPVNYWSAEWQAFWSEWSTKIASGFSLPTVMQSNFVTWSTVGGEDAFWPLDLDRAQLGLATGADYGGEKPYLLDVLSRGDSGFMPLHGQGSIVRVEALANSVMLYGDQAIGALVPTQISYADHMINTFGYKHLANFGVASRTAVGGDSRRHVFVDANGYLWAAMDSEGGPTIERLGFREFLLPVVNEAFAISHEPNEDEVWIATSTVGFVLTASGLVQCSQRPTSLCADGGPRASASPTSFAAMTDRFDMGQRGWKRLTFAGVSSVGLTGLDMRSVSYHDASATPHIGSWVPANTAGTAFLGASGQAFALAFRGTLGDGAKIDDITIRWQASDQRFVRGI